MLSFTILLMAALPGFAQSVQASEKDDIIVLFTNDVHCTNDEGMTYAAIASYKEQMMREHGKDYVTLVDNGDAIQGAVLGTLSKGGWIVDIMNQAGYDLAIPGNHEYDFGMENFLDIVNNQAQYPYISCNFMGANGQPVLEPYKIINYGNVKVAYIGMTTPESISKSNPSHFQNEQGEYIYSFCQGNNGQELYDCVQASIDSARKDGADYVIGLGHLGEDPQSAPWMSTDVIAHTTGMDALLDGHSHTVEPSKLVKNADGEEVLLSQSGTKGKYIGKFVLDKQGHMTSELVPTAEVDQTTTAYKETAAFVKDIQKKYQEVTEEVIATAHTSLTVDDPATGERAIRSAETNLGDFCADAYRTMMGAQIGLVNGGGIRENIAQGEVTYGDIIAVHPFNNTICLVEVTGQQILDALELGAMYAGQGENGGFLQVSGMKYVIDSSISSSVVVDDNGAFVKVNGARRVVDVQVYDERTKQYQPIEADKAYTIAGHNYMLKSCGDGFSMFGKDNIKVLKDETMVDSEVLIDYAKDILGGVIDEPYMDPYGQKRIVFAKSYPDVDADAWYSDAVRYVTGAGLMGTTDGVHFSPSTNMSRAMVYETLYRLEGKPAVDQTIVSGTEGKWYHDCVNWAARIGLYDNNGVYKDMPAKRCEIADYMEKYANYKKVAAPESDNGFEKVADYKDIPHQYLDAMEYCYDAQVMIGNEKGELLPNQPIKRCEFAQVLLGFDDFVNIQEMK